MNAGGAVGEATSAPSLAASAPVGPAPDRLVFFFSGFDPKGAGYYHRMYREGAAARSAFGDARIEVGSRRRAGNMASVTEIVWRAGEPGEPDELGDTSGDVRVVPSGEEVRTRFHYMRWDDIVRRHWERSPLQLVRDYLNVYGIGLPSGDFARIWRKSRAAWGMAIFPLVVAAVSMGIAFPMLWVALRHGDATGPWQSALVATVGAVMMWRWIVRRIDCEWLLRLYAFTQAQAAGTLPVLEARIDEMAAWIVRMVGERLDRADAPRLREVLLVGYSTGSTVAASVLARALPALEARLRDAGAARPAVSMLTLGHCLPVASDWAAANGVREELARLGACEWLTWHDWSSPADWAAFWRTPPWPEGSRLQGVQRSPRFHLQMDPEAYAALKRDRRQMHLQYLRSPGRPVEPSGYDWFRFTAGPLPLAAASPPGARNAASAPVVTPATSAS